MITINREGFSSDRFTEIHSDEFAANQSDPSMPPLKAWYIYFGGDIMKNSEYNAAFGKLIAYTEKGARQMLLKAKLLVDRPEWVMILPGEVCATFTRRGVKLRFHQCGDHNDALTETQRLI